MSDERDDLLKEIGDALRVEPSPSFAAGVRTRLANEPSPRRAGLSWLMWAGAASAAATGVAVFAMWRPVERAVPAPVTTPVVAKAETPVVGPFDSAQRRPIDSAQGGPAPAISRSENSATRGDSGRDPKTTLPLTAPEPDAPSVLTTQGAALNEMWARVLSLTAGPVTEKSSVATTVEASAAVPLPEMKELAVEPIVFAAIELPGVVLQGAVPVIRRVTDGAHR